MAKKMIQMMLPFDEYTELRVALKNMQERNADLMGQLVRLQQDLDRAIAQWGEERNQYKAENATLRHELALEVEPSLEEIDAAIPQIRPKRIPRTEP